MSVFVYLKSYFISPIVLKYICNTLSLSMSDYIFHILMLELNRQALHALYPVHFSYALNPAEFS